MTLPAWLLDALAAQTGEHTAGHAPTARLVECPRCAAPVVTGLDAPACALEATADPHEVDAAGEAIALLLGLSTFHLIHIAKRWELARRGIDALRQDSRRLPVVAEHRCGVTIPASSTPVLPYRPAARDYPDDPPF